MNVNPLLLTDGYKTSHHRMYPEGTEYVYSNFTPRSVKYMPSEAKEIVVFGLQYTIRYIHDVFKNNFFNRDKKVVISEAKRYFDSYLGTDYDMSHFEALHDLGFLPIEIRGLQEGSIVEPRIPIMTIVNINPKFYWLPNFLETLISSLLWKPMHSASLVYGMRKLINHYATLSDKDNPGLDFLLHDFSFRGMQHPESAISSALGFLTSSKGTDSVPALQAANYYYLCADTGFSVPASEHSVACANIEYNADGTVNEMPYFERLFKQYPTGILSIVSDTFDLFDVCTKFLPKLHNEIMQRDGKIVIRPDSGNPVNIVCGELNNKSFKDLSQDYHYEDSPLNHPNFFEDYLLDEVATQTPHGERGVTEYSNTYQINKKLYRATIHNISWNRYDKQYYFIDMFEAAKITVEEIELEPKHKGVVELLWDEFGGIINEQGYKVLDSHIGVIYGDSINIERIITISERLMEKGFASTNIVYGIGSYSMGYATRDNQGSAVKATAVKINGVWKEIFKDPKTDDGTKKSARGLLKVINENGDYKLVDKISEEQIVEEDNCLKIKYLNGGFYNLTTLEEIRNKIKNK